MANITDQAQSSSTRSLTGKVALVTGGSRGIGAAIVERLAREGAAVAFTYRGGREAAEALASRLTAQGARALAILADSADDAAVRGAVERTVETFGGLDILVNNAGILTLGRLVDVSRQDLDRALAVNVRGPLVITQEALRHMRDGGRVVFIGSVNGDFMPFPGASLYSLAKAALNGLTHGLARELGERGITVNDIQPGPVDTDMNPADGPMAASLKPQIAVQRYGRAQEIAALIAHIVGPEGGYISGGAVRIDGGLTA